ncbi:putative MATE family efflux protein [Anaerosolibacter carboniphilus]|uniref:Probable multidrug resistance protein NorM n=1 Tax=Anaerosolibacter carboniphilus TaxID=1417629 RepID=A0A841KYB2_9FIRM|nr:MATE family efflux transporter [Anaerosolibacter carboniphilus]MBB6218333.1 putative MATE family efflux protein [Anaerosolibacter carboniphilus]
MSNDMTKGSVFKILLSFTIPLILTGLLQQLYYITDSMIVGNFIGEAALAAVGVSSPVLNVFIFIVTGLVSGYTILISQYYGAKEYKKISKLSSTFFIFIMFSAFVISIAGFIFRENILNLLHTPIEVLQQSSKYLSIVFIGVPALVLYNLCSSLLRGIGDSKTPLYAIILSTAINIILDLVFVKLFFWGIKGVAIATVIAQIISSVFLLISIYKKHPMFRISFLKNSIDLTLFFDSMKLGAPKMIQSSIASVGSLLLQNVMNTFGIEVVTAITTAYKIDTLTILPIINISIAISIFVGQNIGANNMARAKEGLRKGIFISLIVSIVITTIVVLAGKGFMKSFGVSDAVAAIGQRFFRTCAIFYPILALENAYAAFLQGNKDVVFTSISNILSLALRVLLSYTLAGILGSDVIALSEICSWVLGAILCFSRYKSNSWQKLNSKSISTATE